MQRFGLLQINLRFRTHPKHRPVEIVKQICLALFIVLCFACEEKQHKLLDNSVPLPTSDPFCDRGQLFSFAGAADPSAGNLTFGMKTCGGPSSPSNFSSISSSGMMGVGVARQELSSQNVIQDGVVGTSPDNSLELVSSNASQDTGVCGGTDRFCADVNLRSFYLDREIYRTYVEIYAMSPAINHLGINSDAEAYGLDNQFGLWSYGMMAPKGITGDNASKQWIFEHLSAENFYFKGRVMADLGEFRVNSYTTDYQANPKAASFSDGGYIVVWESNVQDGGGGGTRTVSPFDTVAYGVYGQRYFSNGTKNGAEFLVNTYTTDNQNYPTVAAFTDGRFVVVWGSNLQDGGGGTTTNGIADAYGIYGQLFTSAGAKDGAEFSINSYTTESQTRADVASFTDGRFVVTWGSLGQDGSSHGCYGQLFTSAGAKDGAEFPVSTWTTGMQYLPMIATFSDGHFVVTFYSGDSARDGSGGAALGQLFDSNGDKNGAEFVLNTYTTSNQQWPMVAGFSDGRFVVDWVSPQDPGGTWGIYAQLFTSNGNKDGAEFRVNSYTTNTQYSARSLSFSDGRFFISWISMLQEGSDYGVYGQRYLSNGSADGAEFQLNTYTSGGQTNPHFAVLNNGRFVVVWSSAGTTGDQDAGGGASPSGIFGERYSSSGTREVP